ncbi:hypothetical protein R4Y45_07355 [Holzapfeliella sp. He02]|uniref:DNA-entry nuclease n=1 Tax=Holzapfeliella saturejae TaxID=3082953 RepID=A0ABU8SI54_9LACO
MANFFAIISTIAIIAIITYTVKFIRRRKVTNRKEIDLKKSIQKKLYISIGVLVISIIGVGVTAPPVEKADAGASNQSSSSIDSSSSSESLESSSSSESSFSSASSEKESSKIESASSSSAQQQSSVSNSNTGAMNPAINNNGGEQPNQSKEDAKPDTTTNNETSQQTTTATPAQHGSIKGNINSKIYHVPGGKSYNKLSEANTVYFNSEAEAQAAGYKRAKN